MALTHTHGLYIQKTNFAKIWQNNNGTFSHHKNSKVEWKDKISCLKDLKFHMEWEGN